MNRHVALVGLNPTSPAENAGARPDYNSLAGLLVGGAELVAKTSQIIRARRTFGVHRAGSDLDASPDVFGHAVRSGRGIQAHQTWARVLGLMLAFAILFVSAPAAFMFRQGLGAAVCSAVAGTCVYVIWTLW